MKTKRDWQRVNVFDGPGPPVLEVPSRRKGVVKIFAISKDEL